MDLRLSQLGADQGVPTLVEPRGDVRIESWAAAHRQELRERLRQHGALLFRGFGVGDAGRLAAFLESAGLPLMDYPRGTSPRTPVGEGIYTSTETRPDVAIPMHTEMSYTSVFPQAVAFCCVTPPAVGGATPLMDVRRVLQRLPAGLVEEFDRRQLRYVQIVPLEPTATLERSWPAMFNTPDRGEVERLCAAQEIECSWLDDGALRISSRVPAIRPHPATGEPVWFNQAHVFHLRLFKYLEKQGVADVREQARDYQQGRRSADLEPYQCTYGDGGEIDDEVMDQVRRAISAETIVFAWRRGDLLLLDNFRVGHGRETFEGPRRILAALVAEI